MPNNLTSKENLSSAEQTLSEALLADSSGEVIGFTILESDEPGKVKVQIEWAGDPRETLIHTLGGSNHALDINYQESSGHIGGDQNATNGEVIIHQLQMQKLHQESSPDFVQKAGNLSQRDSPPSSLPSDDSGANLRPGYGPNQDDIEILPDDEPDDIEILPDDEPDDVLEVSLQLSDADLVNEIEILLNGKVVLNEIQEFEIFSTDSDSVKGKIVMLDDGILDFQIPNGLTEQQVSDTLDKMIASYDPQLAPPRESSK